MTAIPGNRFSSSSIRQEHEDDDASWYDRLSKQTTMIPADHRPRDRSIVAGGRPIMDTAASSRQERPVIEKSFSPVKKRATSDDAGRRGAGDSSVRVLPPKKRRVEDATSVDADGAPAAQTHRHDTAADDAPAPPKPSSSSVTPERSAGVRLARQLFAREMAAAARAKKKNRTNSNIGTPRKSTHGAKLHGVLEKLGATAARFVHTKTLHTSDVCSNQNRLLFSCKPEFVADHPITRLLGEKEAFLVFQHDQGLRVNAYDGDGRMFGMKLRYLVSNGGFRLIESWRGFVRVNELEGPVNDKGSHHVEVELWAFRSKQLPEQGEVRQQKVDGLEDHPDGAGNLGLLFLPYVDDIGGHVEEADEEHAPPTALEAKRRRPASAKKEVQKRETDCASQGKKKKKKKKAVAREVTFSEMIVEYGKEKAMSVAGLLKLVRSI